MKKGLGKLVAAVSGAVAGTLAGGMAVDSILRKEMSKTSEMAEKMHTFYIVFNQWLSLRQEGRTLAEYFEAHNYKTVAIYGMKELGERLYDELKDSDVIVKYAIDRDADAMYAEVEVITPDEELKPVDVIVVTAVYYFDEIQGTLGKKTGIPVVSLEDVVYEM